MLSRLWAIQDCITTLDIYFFMMDLLNGRARTLALNLHITLNMICLQPQANCQDKTLTPKSSILQPILRTPIITRPDNLHLGEQNI
jgi:hypothetical protein